MRRHRSWYAAALAAGAAVVLLGAKCSLFNKAPAVPAVTGPAQGVAGVPVTFKATATDPDGDSIAFQFDWGDTTTPAWSAFLVSGETLSAAHTYADSGNYTVKAKAKDRGGKESGWSVEQALAVAGPGPGYPDSLYGAIRVGPRAVDGYVTPDGRYLYVMHDDADYITPVRLADRTVLPRITVSRAPTSMVATPDGRLLYVSCNADTLLPVVDIDQQTVTAWIDVGRMPRDIAMSPDGALAYVGLSQDEHIAVIRTADNTVVDSIPLGNNAHRLAMSPSGDRVFVSMRRDRIGVVDRASCRIVDSLSVGRLPDILSVSPQGDRLYVCNQGDEGYVAIATSSLLPVHHVDLDDPYSNGLAVLPDGATILVTNSYGLNVVSAAVGIRLALVTIGMECGVAVRPQGDTAYLFGRDTVYIMGKP